ncbi:MAG: TolC family protein, partial [bacterium]
MKSTLRITVLFVVTTLTFGCAIFGGQKPAGPPIVIGGETGAMALIPEGAQKVEITRAQVPLILKNVDLQTSPIELLKRREVYGPELVTGPEVPLTLEDVLYKTLSNNLNIRIEDYSRKVSQDEVSAQKGIYDLLLTLKYVFNAAKAQTNSAFSGAPVLSTRSGSFEASLKQLLPLGTNLTLFFDHVRNTSNSAFSGFNPVYNSAATLSINQPLLKNFGPKVTNQQITIARNNEEIAQEQFRQQVMDQMKAALNAYWDLVFAVNNVEVQKLSLARANDLLRINQIKFDAGVLPSTDVLQAKAQVASFGQAVIQAESQVQTQQDQLKRLMNVADTNAEWRANLVPTEKPYYYEQKLDEDQFIEEALQLRPEVRKSDIDLRIRELNKDVAWNQRLPELNLFGSYGRTGLAGSSDRSLDFLEDSEFDNYSAGAELIYPLQNREGRYRYRQAVKKVEQGIVMKEDTIKQVTLEVRQAMRSVQTNRKQIDVTKSSVEFEAAKLDAEQRRYEVGATTSFELLNFQEDLASAEVSRLQAVVNYNKSLIELDRSRGTLLDRYGIR